MLLKIIYLNTFRRRRVNEIKDPKQREPEGKERKRKPKLKTKLKPGVEDRTESTCVAHRQQAKTK